MQTLDSNGDEKEMLRISLKASPNQKYSQARTFETSENIFISVLVTAERDKKITGINSYGIADVCLFDNDTLLIKIDKLTLKERQRKSFKNFSLTALSEDDNNNIYIGGHEAVECDIKESTIVALLKDDLSYDAIYSKTDSFDRWIEDIIIYDNKLLIIGTNKRKFDIQTYKNFPSDLIDTEYYDYIYGELKKSANYSIAEAFITTIDKMGNELARQIFTTGSDILVNSAIMVDDNLYIGGSIDGEQMWITLTEQ